MIHTPCILKRHVRTRTIRQHFESQNSRWLSVDQANRLLSLPNHALLFGVLAVPKMTVELEQSSAKAHSWEQLVNQPLPDTQMLFPFHPCKLPPSLTACWHTAPPFRGNSWGSWHWLMALWRGWFELETPYWKAKQFLFDVHNYLMLWLVIPVHQAGMTNRLIKWRAQTIFTSFTHTVEVSSNSLSAVTQNVSHCIQSCCQGAGDVVWIRCRYPETSIALSVGNLSHCQGEKKEKLEANALGAKHIAWIKGYLIWTCANKKATASLILF